MKLVLLAIAIASSVAPVGATDLVAPPAVQQPLQLRPKVLVASPVASSAPFVSGATERELDLAPRREAGHEMAPSSCASAHTVCYDPAAGHIVFKPARLLMPTIPGLQRENISLRRDRIVFRYSF